jgi:hypothetical protein
VSIRNSPLVFLPLLLLAGSAGCGDDGTTTTCEEMPIIEQQGEGGAVDPTTDAEYSAWRRQAVRDGCATPSGDPNDFVVK